MAGLVTEPSRSSSRQRCLGAVFVAAVVAVLVLVTGTGYAVIRVLGGRAAGVVFVAVNVNRYHLRVADVAAFPGEQRLTTIPTWHFLTGPYPSSRAIWQAYHVADAAPARTLT
jgi:hypothetical protein